MKTEREKFEAWLKAQPHVLNVGINNNGTYMLKEDQAAWEAWQAAKVDAVPDGFVVVPKEPTINQVKAMTDYVLGEDAQGLEVGMLCNEAKDIYKAMISAGEKEMITEHNGQLWRNGNEVYFSGQWIKVTNPPKEVRG